METLHAVWTALLMILFILIFIRAWSRKRTQEYHEAAHIPLKDDNLTKGSSRDG